MTLNGSLLKMISRYLRVLGGINMNEIGFFKISFFSYYLILELNNKNTIYFRATNFVACYFTYRFIVLGCMCVVLFHRLKE